MISSLPDLSIERSCKGAVAGVDEAGRGPWAGPVVAAAVILTSPDIPPGINDSKQLSRQRREELHERIRAVACCAVGIATVEEIDALNILQATKLAMQRAVAGLAIAPDMALIDGNQPPDLPCEKIAVVRGDGKSLSIAAASIIAKVTRDRIMCELGAQFPPYGWERNAGYGTKTHQEALRLFGVTPHHRRSFAPVRCLLPAESREAA